MLSIEYNIFNIQSQTSVPIALVEPFFIFQSKFRVICKSVYLFCKSFVPVSWMDLSYSILFLLYSRGDLWKNCSFFNSLKFVIMYFLNYMSYNDNIFFRKFFTACFLFFFLPYSRFICIFRRYPCKLLFFQFKKKYSIL